MIYYYVELQFQMFIYVNSSDILKEILVNHQAREEKKLALYH